MYYLYSLGSLSSDEAEVRYNTEEKKMRSAFKCWTLGLIIYFYTVYFLYTCPRAFQLLLEIGCPFN